MSTPDTPEPSTPPFRRSRRPRWPGVVGSIIGLVGVAFVVRTFLDNRQEVLDAAGSARPALLAVAWVLGLAGMTGIGLAWRSALLVLGGELGVAVALRGYFVGQMGKYVPGGIWAIMGRGEWARNEGVAGSVAYSSVVASIGSAYLAAVLVAVALLPFSGLLGSSGDARFAPVLALLPIGFALIHPRVVRSILTVIRRVTRREIRLDVPSWGQSAGLVVRQIPSWFLIGSATLLVSAALGSSGDPANLISAAAVSWVVGFLALPVPGGIGVREAAFVALATSLPVGIAATVALVARLLFIAVDLSGAAASTLVLASRSERIGSR